VLKDERIEISLTVSRYSGHVIKTTFGMRTENRAMSPIQQLRVFCCFSLVTRLSTRVLNWKFVPIIFAVSTVETP
jgi:hypothetical protein